MIYSKSASTKKKKKKRKSYKTIFKGSIHSFYDFGKGSQREKPARNDLKYLSNFNHTATLEVYHSLHNKYCPKRLHFSYEGMIACSQLVVLDFNPGDGLKQAETKLGELRFKQQFSKVTQQGLQKNYIKQRQNLS